MKINVAREIAARIWCDPKMSNTAMDAALAEEIAQLLASRLTPAPADSSPAGCLCLPFKVYPDCPIHGNKSR